MKILDKSVTHFKITFKELLDPEFLRTEYLLQNSPKFYIPIWQRDYDWGDNQIDSFFKGLENMSQEQPFHLGNIILMRAKYKKGKITETDQFFYIVDGQQRIRSLHKFYKMLLSNIPSLRSVSLKELQQYNLYKRKKLNLYSDKNPLRTISESWDKQQEIRFQTKFKSYLKNRKTTDLSYVLESIQAVLTVISVTFDGRNSSGNEDFFDVLMANVFEQVNRQTVRLSDDEILKARLIFNLQENNKEDKAIDLADQWRIAKALVWGLNPEDIDNPSLLSTNLPRHGEADIYHYQLRKSLFYRYLLLALSLCIEIEPNAADTQDILRPKELLKLFTSKLGDTVDDSLRYLDVLKWLNNFFKNSYPFLLLSRSNLKDSSIAEISYKGKRYTLLLTLLKLQCFIASGSKSGSWLENRILFKLLINIRKNKVLSNYKGLGDIKIEHIEQIIKITESLLFEYINQTKQKHLSLTAKDWFLEKNLFSSTPQKTFLKGFKAINSLISHNKRIPESNLLSELQKFSQPFICKPNYIPKSTGAEEIEHWIAMERGNVSNQELAKVKDTPSNWAHIANGLNQSLRDKSIEDKATLIDAHCWPTLKFLAFITLILKSRGVSIDQQDSNKVNTFLSAITEFWTIVSNDISSEDVQNKNSSKTLFEDK